MKAILVTLCATTLILSGEAQIISKPNTIYFELGGNGLFTSINYERQILKSQKLNFHFGLGKYGINPGYLTVPLGLNYVLPLNKYGEYIDLGFGATYSKADVQLYAIIEHKEPGYKNTRYWNYIPSVGFRKLTRNNVMYRFSFTPVCNHNAFLPYIGLSLGWSFF